MKPAHLNGIQNIYYANLSPVHDITVNFDYVSEESMNLVMVDEMEEEKVKPRTRGRPRKKTRQTPGKTQTHKHTPYSKSSNPW